ncbi:MAG: hypothetical protein KDC95_08135 [Planctomycetes bacterium]|nr:hypothetical protein [Planctomycetota bacterium]
MSRTPSAVRPLLPSLASAVVAATLVAPAARTQNPWNDMDYGPFQTATVSAADAANVTHKGLAIKIPGEGTATLLFDTELLRASAIWQGGWLHLRGTPYDGGHGSWSSLRGEEVTATRVLPGWSKERAFVDPRALPHGPMPHEYGRYRGLWLDGPRVTVGYDVFGTKVLETANQLPTNAGIFLARDLDIGTTTEPLFLAIHDRPFGVTYPGANGAHCFVDRMPRPGPVEIEKTSGDWGALRTGAPSSKDYASTGKVTMTVVAGFSPVHGPHGPADELATLHDGAAAQNNDDTERCVWFDRSGDHKVGRIAIDLGGSVDVRRVHVYSWHKAERAPQNWRLFASNAETMPMATATDLDKAGWQPVGRASTRELGRGGKHVVALSSPRGGSISNARWLVLETEPEGTANGTFLTEIDIWTAGDVGQWHPNDAPQRATGLALAGDTDGVSFVTDTIGGHVALRLEPREHRNLRIVAWRGEQADFSNFAAAAGSIEGPGSLERFTKGGPRRWPEVLETKGIVAKDDGSPWVVDTITVPESNPWKSRLRFGAFDFFEGGKKAALCTWNGDVWIVDGIDDKLENLRWSRFATGLFETLGLLIENDEILVHGRDGITRLHDLNGDGEADYYECFNNDVYVTKGFHEFAFDLQRAPNGNYYFSKGGPVNPGGRGFMKITPHAGTILELSPDGKKLSVFATGVRAPNGIGVGPNGEITSGDNEGTWMPRCRLNWIERGDFLGCVPLAHRDEPPTTYDPPLCWLPFAVDNSSGGQVWTPNDSWGMPKDTLLHMSYGQCKLYRVLPERVDGVMQGGITEVPATFASSCMRGRFSKADGQLYVVGFKGWQTRAVQETAFQRVRRTNGEVRMPCALHVRPGGVELEFTCALDPETANDPESWAVHIWNYLWTSDYGSPEVSVKNPTKIDKNTGSYNKAATNPTARDPLVVKSARLLDGGKRVFLELPEIQPVMQMQIAFNLDSADGEVVRGHVWNTIHEIPQR